MKTLPFRNLELAIDYNGEYEMEPSLIKTVELGNGLKLEFYDLSRKLAGDRWYVGVVARIDIPVTDSLLMQPQFSPFSDQEIKAALGETVRFQQKQERHFIDELEKDAMLNRLMNSFIQSSLTYLSHPDFSTKFVLKEFQAYRKRRTWDPDVRRK